MQDTLSNHMRAYRQGLMTDGHPLFEEVRELVSLYSETMCIHHEIQTLMDNRDEEGFYDRDWPLIHALEDRYGRASRQCAILEALIEDKIKIQQNS